MAKFGFLSHSDMSKAQSRKSPCDEPQRTPQSHCGIATATRRILPKFVVLYKIYFADFIKTATSLTSTKNSYRFANLSLKFRIV